MTKAWIGEILGILISAASAAGQIAPIRVLASGGIRGVLEQIQPQCEHNVGHKLAIEYNSTAVLKKKIEADDPFDVVIGTSEAVNDLSKEGKLAASHQDIGRVGTGIGARADAPRTDISTPESLKRTLLKAKSVTYGAGGASAVVVLSMFDKLGIADQMNRKANPLQGADLITQSVVEGKNQYVITLVSEILPVKGLQLVGSLPAAFQQYTNFAVGISANAHNPDASKIAQCFAGPEVASVYKAVGMEQPTSTR